VVYTATAPYDEVLCDVQHTSTTTSTLLFTVAPTTGQYRAVFHG
jgi:2-keto-3-deoxy-L-rhamnonate aldolase RhmA